MTFLALNLDVSFGLVGGRAVFLDLARDRYLALDAANEAAFARVRGADAAIVPEGEDVERLLSTGLFRTSDRAGTLSPASISIPDHSLLAEPSPGTFPLTSSIRIWVKLARARRRLRTVPLIELVAHVRDRRSSGEAAKSPPEPEEAAASYLSARALVPINRSCLLDCLGLVDWLGPRGHHAKLVFGVRMDPFGAHCWLQTDRSVLTDASDTVRNFAPVLVV